MIAKLFVAVKGKQNPFCAAVNKDVDTVRRARVWVLDWVIKYAAIYVSRSKKPSHARDLWSDNRVEAVARRMRAIRMDICIRVVAHGWTDPRARGVKYQDFIMNQMLWLLSIIK